ncbi:hypothetical protein BpHYR1_012096 [Brachionus plicatilis]|uniref:Uncharacterized protein n=1 Tax=Brachionus plicatilis TaxID=10195 RepID=A0A3M7R336_BRAPC|nr:hypothetical protein BpHYR1_012096 [Brachionus plicatilis]
MLISFILCLQTIVEHVAFFRKFFLGLPLPLFSGASTFLLISLLVDACTTFSASLSIVFLFFFVGITVSCGVSSSTSCRSRVTEYIF